MIWGMVLSSGKIFIKKLNGTFNSSKYKPLLSETAVSIIKTELGDDFPLQWIILIMLEFQVYHGQP